LLVRLLHFFSNVEGSRFLCSRNQYRFLYVDSLWSRTSSPATACELGMVVAASPVVYRFHAAAYRKNANFLVLAYQAETNRKNPVGALPLAG